MTKMIWVVAVALIGLTDPVSQVELAGVKCVVSGKQVTSQYATPYRSGVIYFDCNQSRLKFESEPTRFATKANHQLVVTGQYIQAHCPMSGWLVTKPKYETQIAAVKIWFCCQHCRNKLNKIDQPQAKIDRIFSNDKFDAIFNSRDQHSTKDARSKTGTPPQ